MTKTASSTTIMTDPAADTKKQTISKDDAPTDPKTEAIQAALNWYRATFGDNPILFPIGLITVPTLYVWGDEDFAVGRVPAEATANFVSGPYQFETLEGVSHWIPGEAREQFNSLLLAHLAMYSAR